MPAMGLEPIRGCPQQILSLPRLPFRHAGSNKKYINITRTPLQEKNKLFLKKENSVADRVVFEKKYGQLTQNTL